MSTTPLLHQAELLESRRLSSAIVMHTYRASEVARAAMPGHFVHIRVTDETAPLLRRPISILDADPAAGTYRIVFKVVGTGTRILAAAQVGDKVDTLGPLGSTFGDHKDIAALDATKKLVLVAGGIGMAPLHYLARTLKARKEATKRPTIEYWFGARSGDEIYLIDDLNNYCDRVETVTEDGSKGRTGRVTQWADEEMCDADLIITCGPNPMMADLQRRTLDWSTPRLASMESFMGCGLGACLGCVVPTVDGLERVCSEGPVFKLERLVF